MTQKATIYNINTQVKHLLSEEEKKLVTLLSTIIVDHSLNQSHEFKESHSILAYQYGQAK